MTIIACTEIGGLETKSEIKISPNARTSDPYFVPSKKNLY